ncbi:MAG: hypothetical protein WC238_00665 [Parcubacteria group bacterium]|jgi:hypothetical protein
MGKILIPKKDLERLYHKEKKSKYKIAAIYNCTCGTVLSRMREYSMESLSRSVIQSTYKKSDFKGDKCEKAYIIGFRLGDLNVYKTTEKSEVIVVRCHTTCVEQVDVMKKMFGRYGQVSARVGKDGSHTVNSFLNESFDFLIKKEDKVEGWITESNEYSNYFAAGYIDAEANVGVYDGRARFKIDTYDKNIIFWFYNWLLKNNVNCPAPRKIGSKNQIYDKIKNYKYNKDLWRVRVSEQKALKILFDILLPILKHKTRKKHVVKCIKNLDDRRSKKL